MFFDSEIPLLRSNPAEIPQGAHRDILHGLLPAAAAPLSLCHGNKEQGWGDPLADSGLGTPLGFCRRGGGRRGVQGAPVEAEAAGRAGGRVAGGHRPAGRSPMPPPGHLSLRRGRGAPLLLLGLLLALPPAAQGLPDVGLSAAQTAHQHPQKHFAQGTLKPAAHLVGDPSARHALRWRASTDRAFLRHGFALRNNSLLVPASGLYFIYSQVVFSGQGCCPSASPAPIYLAHEVQLFSAQYRSHVSLLSAQKSVSPGPQGPWVRSVYQGAVFLLTRGDQLSTSTDGIDHLLLGPSTVFFGAFAL
ncbi:lymphotoxin-alpha isoform X3 [Myotis daubentonii]|uniref:lymphotoxin-alpha isoform X3 n=1 Tax=Myotis daubentonii TaxID=98922 RepID=UPI002873215F|nr:lymphotoxin-alpha isoform X3 [Myotis daubentonii]